MVSFINGLLDLPGAIFTRLGWSRDDAKWLWVQICAFAGLVSAGVFDVHAWVLTYIGWNLSNREILWFQLLCGAVVAISARMSTSPLWPKGDVPTSNNSVKSVSVGSWVLIIIGVGSLLTAVMVLPGCAPKNLHAAVVVDATISDVLHTIKVEEQNSYKAGLYDKAVHKKNAKNILKALKGGNALNDAVDAWRKAGAGALTPQIVSDTVDALRQLAKDLNGLLPPGNPLLLALNKGLALLGS